MHINFRQLKIQNFLSFENEVIDLTQPGYILVQGVNNNPKDMATSNGSGKSSLFEAISWVLTGETIRGSKEVVNFYADNGASVELVFDIDGKPYKVVRTKDFKPMGTTLKLYVNQKDISGKGIRDTSKILEEHLPDLTASLLGSVILLGQGLPQRFSNNTPSGRKEVLETLSRSDFMIEDLKKRVQSRLFELEKSYKEISDKNIQVTTEKNLLEKELSTLKHELENVEDITNIQTKLNTEEQQRKNYSSQLEESKKEKEKIYPLLEEVEGNYQTISMEKESSIREIVNKFTEDIVSLKTTITEYKTTIKAKEEEVRKYKNIKDTCPTCGQKLPGVVKVDTSNVENEIIKLKIDVSSLSSDLTYLESKQSTSIKEVEDQYTQLLNESIDKKRNYKNQENELNKIINNLSATISNLDISIARYTQQIENYNTKIETIKNNINNKETRIEELNSTILYINNRTTELKERLDILNKMKNILNRDFRGVLLSSIIEFINTKAKEYSKSVFNTELLDFVLDGNNVQISYDGKDYSNLSGGERQKIDLIIQFAIRDMLVKYMNFSSNILVVDELFDNLDSIGCEKVLNMISTKLTDVASLYIITHHSEIPIPFDSIITVTKEENGFSHISNVI